MSKATTEQKATVPKRTIQRVRSQGIECIWHPSKLIKRTDRKPIQRVRSQEQTDRRPKQGIE